MGAVGRLNLGRKPKSFKTDLGLLIASLYTLLSCGNGIFLLHDLLDRGFELHFVHVLDLLTLTGEVFADCLFGDLVTLLLEWVDRLASRTAHGEGILLVVSRDAGLHISLGKVLS